MAYLALGKLLQGLGLRPIGRARSRISRGSGSSEPECSALIY
jgi:hypothetical protein